MMQPWFPKAKLGIFIHWGIYSVKGIPESWSFFNREITYEDYMGQLEEFTASKFDAKAWAELFKKVGAEYVVLTTKHHDGVALFDTELSPLNTVDATPAGRDLIAEYSEAVKAAGLRLGFYFSHLDWSHPDYAPAPVGQRFSGNLRYNEWEKGPDTPEWRKFLEFQRGQLKELCTNYGEVDLLWFDGDWEPGHEWWGWEETRDLLHGLQPNVVINSRLGECGDYATPEQGIPIARPEGPWEFCVTVNDSWGYQPQDNNHKSVRQIIRMFCEVIGMGGNLLLDIGPKEDGTILPEQVERLEGLGAWIKGHGEAVSDTVAGLPAGHFYGASTLSEGKDTLYLMLFDKPWDSIAVKGIRNGIKRVSVVGSGEELQFRKVGGAPWMDIPGVLWVDVPEACLDPNATVIKVELDGPLNLYTGAGKSISAN